MHRLQNVKHYKHILYTTSKYTIYQYNIYIYIHVSYISLYRYDPNLGPEWTLSLLSSIPGPVGLQLIFQLGLFSLQLIKLLGQGAQLVPPSVWVHRFSSKRWSLSILIYIYIHTLMFIVTWNNREYVCHPLSWLVQLMKCPFFIILPLEFYIVYQFYICADHMFSSNHFIHVSAT